MKQYLINWLHLIDQMFNTLLAGDPRETLSARMGRDVLNGRCRFCKWICLGLNRIQNNHCAEAWNGEQKPLTPDMQITPD